MNQSIYKASFYTLGCRLNQTETAIISSTFKEKGNEIGRAFSNQFVSLRAEKLVGDELLLGTITEG